MDTRTGDGGRRTLDKQEAIRHLIHAAIRLIAKEEDRFAIHVLIQSAEKMLIDMGEKLGKELHFDWEWYIKPEYHKKFFTKNRSLYNFFKHAKKDFDAVIPIEDIMKLNTLPLSICCANYSQLFSKSTVHMWVYSIFVAALYPEIIKPTDILGAKMLKEIPSFEGITPREFFEVLQKDPSIFSRCIGEAANDRADIGDFYHLSFAELRSGKTKSHRIFRIREYHNPQEN